MRSKGVLINLFVGQQVCKQAHTRRTRVTVVHLLIADRFLCTCTVLNKPDPDCRSSSSFSDKLLLDFTSAFHNVAPHGNMPTTRRYRYYRGKTNSYCGENIYRYIANYEMNVDYSDSGMSLSISGISISSITSAMHRCRFLREGAL